MKRVAALAAALTTIGLAACGNGGLDAPPLQPPPAPASQAVVFTNFVKQQFANTADDTHAVTVDATDFTFNDLDDPDAYDDLLANL